MENITTLILTGAIAAIVGSIVGYFVRQAIVKKRKGSIEASLQKKIEQSKKDSEKIIEEAKEQAKKYSRESKEEEEKRRREVNKTQDILLQRERILEKKISDFDQKEKDFTGRVEKVKRIKENLLNLKEEVSKKLETVSGISKEDAKAELLNKVEQENESEIMEKMRRLEDDGIQKVEKRAKEILAFAIQKCALSQAQDITVSTVALPSDEIKGKIIGKEGRNIKTLERLTGVEVIIDETPETAIISSFDPVRRQIAKLALEKLMQDGRIQPARIEGKVEEAEKEIAEQIKKSGEQAVYDLGVVGFDSKLVQLIGRLRFRTSYGQNVLLHSMEVAHIAAGIAGELGANVAVCKKAGLLHDIGKAVDHQFEGSHVDIGIKILNKFNVDKNITAAMKSHHEEYPAESLEAIIVQAADQISGARPGARKDTVENYIKRLEELEAIANSFKGIDKTYAIQAGRELRVFVKPNEVNDMEQKKLAKQIADRIHEELKYPGEIKVVVIRENRVIEHAK
jgi:ribonuclease Y